jgi:hypothetical protein
MLLEILNWSPKKRIIKPKGPEWYIHYPRADGPTKGGARVAAYILLLPHGPWRLGVPLHQNPSSHRAASAPPVLDSTGWKSATTTSPSTPWTASRYTFFPNTSALVFQDSDRFVRGPQVVVPPHPLISHWVSVIRDHSTPTHSFSKFFLGPNSIVGLVSNVYKFRFMVCNFFACWSTSWAGSAMGELGRLLAYEATRDWLVYS